MRTHLIRGAIALAVVLAVSAPAAAQQVLKGTVVDENGKPLEGAVITIQSTESNRRYDVTSDEGGEFVQIGLNSGEYNVLAEKSNMRQILPATVNRSRVAELAFELTEFSHLTPEKAKEQMEISAMADSATAALAADRNDEAIKILTSLVEKFPGCTDCYFNLGIAYVKTNDFSGAEAAYKQAIDTNPESANAYTGLANLYNQMKKFDLAQEASTKAAELAAGAGGAGGDDANALYNQGVILWNSGKFPEAKIKFEAAIEADPKLAMAHYQLGMANLNLGQVPEARASFEQYLEVDPDGPKAGEVKTFVEQLPK
jgi:tetratricopeptide (TPR) repeat protein